MRPSPPIGGRYVASHAVSKDSGASFRRASLDLGRPSGGLFSSLASAADRPLEHLANVRPHRTHGLEHALDLLGADEVRLLLGDALVVGDEVRIACQRAVRL